MRSARIPPNPPNPPNPGQNDPVPGQTSLQGPGNPAVEAVRTPSPYLCPSGKPVLGCPRTRRHKPCEASPPVFSNPDMSMNGLVEEPEGGAKVRVDGGNDCGVGGAGGQDAATREASRGGGGTDHAAGFSALATSRKSALRVRWTSWAASRSVAACARGGRVARR